MSTAEQIADEIYGLHCDIGRLEAENAKLHEELEAVGTAAYLYGRDDLKAENAELRTQLADVTESMGRVEERCAKLLRLAEDLFRDFVNADDELRLRCGRTFMAWARYASRLRDLGAKVS